MSAQLQARSADEGRAIVHRTKGSRHGPIVRLMSPADLGQRLKPFVFLDYFDVTPDRFPGFGLHPHSGIATITVILEGDARYEDTDGRRGVIATGGVEWMKAGGGAWHAGGGSEAPRVRGFQLWIALLPEEEAGASESRYLAPEQLPHDGPATLILGRVGGLASSITTPAQLNYLVVRLKAGERWSYRPPQDHAVGWVAVARGTLQVGGAGVDAGELAAFEPSATGLDFIGESDVEFVLGSAPPHRHPLVLGHYSVHTSADALAAGERRIAELGRALPRVG